MFHHPDIVSLFTGGMVVNPLSIIPPLVGFYDPRQVVIVEVVCFIIGFICEVKVGKEFIAPVFYLFLQRFRSSYR